MPYKLLLIVAMVLLTLTPLHGQKHKKYTRQGNRDYTESNFDNSEILYRRAIDADPSFNKAVFNLGDALYKQEKYEEATDNFSQLSELELNKQALAESYYNMGNSLLKSGKIEESIDSYKNALRNDPANMEAKYNLAYAQDLLKQQQQQQQQNDGSQEEQDKNQQEDQQPPSDENEEQQQDGQQDEPEQDEGQDQQEQQQQKPQQISKEDAERLLQALAENEKDVQEKVKKAKAAEARVRTLKNW
jgi:tetratricopeptide (TPR) repeat protein